MQGRGISSTSTPKRHKLQKDVELIAVVEKYSDKSAALAQKFKIKKQYHTGSRDAQGWRCGCVGDRHTQLFACTAGICALKAGVHVMVEKPMAMNTREAEKMLEASAKSGAKLTVAHCWRFDNM